MPFLPVDRCVHVIRLLPNLTRLQKLTSVSSKSIHTSLRLNKERAKKQKGKSVQAQKWVSRQLADVYVRRARTESYRCRSAFKLIEADDKHNILRHGDVVVDCGAAPGSWCEVAVKRVNAKAEVPDDAIGRVIGVDIQHMAAVDGATIVYQTDFTQPHNQQHIIKLLGEQKADVVLSDMAPNATGIRNLDHEIIVKLCFSALQFGTIVLRDGGKFMGKIWQGPDQERLEAAMRTCFRSVHVVKPLSSRTDSAEIFLLGKGFTRQKRL